MRFGVALPNFGALGTRDVMVEVAREAEALGFDSVWTTDHVMVPVGFEEPYGQILESLMTLGYLACATQRVGLGTSILVLPQREPVLMAKQIATLDHLSGGRVILGVGAGWNEGEFGFLRADFASRGRRMDEIIRAMRALWTSPDPRFEGEFVSFSGALFSPSPVQPGGPPIWIGGTAQSALRRAAQLGDAWHASADSLEDFAAGMRRVHALSDGRQVLGTLRMRTAIDRQLPVRHAGDGHRLWTLDGSVTEIVERLRAYEAAGLSYLVAHFGDENDRASCLEDMRRFARDVLPAFTRG
jgi:probable F420-dependent oxidoreductase